MSLDVLTAIWRDPPCKGGDLLCLLAIADNADDEGFAWPSISTIARKAAMSERGAQKCVRKLADSGLICIKAGGGRNKTNAYQITTNGVGECEENKNPEQNTPNPGSPFSAQNPEQRDINPEQRCAKPRTPVRPNSQEPSIEPSLKNACAKSSKIMAELCSVLSRDVAADFMEHRKAKRSSLTLRAAELIAAKLRGNPNADAVALNSIQNGWTGVFPEKVKPTVRAKETGSERADRIAAIYASEVDNGASGDPVVPLLPARQSG